MQDKPSDFQVKLEKTVSTAIEKLSQADQGDIRIAKAHDAALDLLTLLTRPIKVAIGGEFSSGKSTFVKMLLGQHVVDMQASASAMPTVSFLYGAETTYRAITAQRSWEVRDIEALTEDELRGLECLEIVADVPFLKQYEIFDTPGTADPSRSVDQLLSVAAQADFVIWCTNATQAWRESERRMWENLPFELKKRSLLIVTHVDLPSVKPSMGRLMKRMKKEAGLLFKKIIPMELLSASAARNESGMVTNEVSWVVSGGADCLEAMADVSAEVRADVFDNVVHDLENKILPVIAEIEANTPEFAAYWMQELSKTQTKLHGADGAMTALGHLKLVEGVLAYITKSGVAQSTEAQKMAPRLQEAQNYIGNILLKDGSEQNPEESSTIIAQLDWEFKHVNILS